MTRRGFRLGFGLGLLGAVLALAWLTGDPGAADASIALVDVRRDRGPSGLEVVRARLEHGARDRGALVAVYADLATYRPRIALNPGRRPLEAWLEDAEVVANAGYFTRERRPTGLLASAGELLHPFVPEAGAAGSGVLLVEDGEARLLERDAVGARDFASVELAIQAGPRIIEPDGSPGIWSDDGMRANRTVLGIDGTGRLVVAVVHADDAGLARGPSLFELQNALGPEGLGRIAPELALRAALNLDGGPSSGLFARAPRIALPAASRVVSVLTLEKR